jgi:hypothetical protein
MDAMVSIQWLLYEGCILGVAAATVMVVIICRAQLLYTFILTCMHLGVCYLFVAVYIEVALT